MTAVDLDALDAARAAATPGPWAQHPADLLYVIGDISDGGESYLDVADTVAAEYPDAALIVAAVNALPDLLAAVRERDALRAAMEGLAEELDGERGYDYEAVLAYADAAFRIRAALAPQPAAAEGTNR